MIRVFTEMLRDVLPALGLRLCDPLDRGCGCSLSLFAPSRLGSSAPFAGAASNCKVGRISRGLSNFCSVDHDHVFRQSSGLAFSIAGIGLQRVTIVHRGFGISKAAVCSLSKRCIFRVGRTGVHEKSAVTRRPWCVKLKFLGEDVVQSQSGQNHLGCEEKMRRQLATVYWLPSRKVPRQFLHSYRNQMFGIVPMPNRADAYFSSMAYRFEYGLTFFPTKLFRVNVVRI